MRRLSRLLSWLVSLFPTRQRRRQPGAFVREDHADNVADAEAIIQKLRRWRGHNVAPRVFAYLRKIDPAVFEEVVLSVLRHYGADIVRNRSYSGDGGIDGRFIWPGKWSERRSAPRRTYAIQCKRYSGVISHEHVAQFARIVAKNSRYAGGIFVHTGRTPKQSWHTVQSAPIHIISGAHLLDFLLGRSPPRQWMHRLPAGGPRRKSERYRSPARRRRSHRSYRAHNKHSRHGKRKKQGKSTSKPARRPRQQRKRPRRR